LSYHQGIILLEYERRILYNVAPFLFFSLWFLRARNITTPRPSNGGAAYCSRVSDLIAICSMLFQCCNNVNNQYRKKNIDSTLKKFTHSHLTFNIAAFQQRSFNDLYGFASYYTNVTYLSLHDQKVAKLLVNIAIGEWNNRL